ncbi:MAG: hypothetical protein AB1742_02990 [bacterium]
MILNGFSGGGAAALDARRLLEMRLVRLGEVFSAAGLPQAEKMPGRYRCLWLAGPEDGYIPGPLRRLKRRLAAGALFPWKGMAIAEAPGGGGVRGVNLLFRLEKGAEMFNFEPRVEPSVFDGGECLVFDYNVAGNNRLFRKLRDEVRIVNPNLFLGRGNILIGGKPRFIAYFSIEPV